MMHLPLWPQCVASLKPSERAYIHIQKIQLNDNSIFGFPQEDVPLFVVVVVVVGGATTVAFESLNWPLTATQFNGQRLD